MQIINPYNQEVISTVETDSQTSISEKFNLAKTAQKDWATTSVDQRIEVIKKFCELLKENANEVATTLTNEMGKPLSESLGEINGAIYRTTFFIEHVKETTADKHVYDDGTTKEVLRYEPLGVISNISAWNYPLLVGVNVFIPALLTGNAVLYKPSEYTTLTGIKVAELLKDAGLPSDVLQVIVGKGDVGNLLTDLPVDGVFFTGSYKTGNAIYQKLAPKMIPVGLELGGKDPMYITDEFTDLKLAAASILEGAFYNNGQSCCAVERVYAHENIYPQLLEEVKTQFKNISVGNPMEEGISNGPIARPEHVSFLNTQVNEATEKGAQVLCQYSEVPEGFFSPTVLTEVTHDMSVMIDESFGPIIGIQKVSSDEECHSTNE